MMLTYERWMAAPWIHFRSIPSTNRYLLELPEAEAEEGTVCTAEVQTEGCGRGDRVWVSPFGGLYFSLLLTPNVPVQRWHLISFVSAVAAVDAIRGVFPDLKPSIKWPNDILIGDRKVAGILVQSNSGEAARLVTGIGINVSNPPHLLPKRALFPAGILNLETAYPVSVRKLAETLRSMFFGYYAEWLNDTSKILTCWEARSAMRNHIVSIAVNGITHRGMYGGITDNGSLKLNINGRTEQFCSGDVTGMEAV